MSSHCSDETDHGSSISSRSLGASTRSSEDSLLARSSVDSLPASIEDIEPRADRALTEKLFVLVEEIEYLRDELGMLPCGMQCFMDDGIKKLIEACETTIKNTREAPQFFLHDLGNIEPPPDIEDVKKVIDMYPETLNDKNIDGLLPIQSAILPKNGGGIKYIALLAEEASKREVGFERGGLLLPVPLKRICVLDCLVRLVKGGKTLYDELCEQALKEIHEAGLLMDEDFDRFSWASACGSNNSGTLKRLNFLFGLYPKQLSVSSRGNLPIHIAAHSGSIEKFALAVKIGMEHHSKEFAFLFEKNAKGERTIALAIRKKGRKRTLRIIQKYIPPSANYPILHSIYNYTPGLVDDFLWYVNSMDLRDAEGRLILHIVAKNNAILPAPVLMRLNANKQWLEEKDPVTNLYPFMLSASGKNKDLTMIYELLTSCPDVIPKCLLVGKDLEKDCE